MRAAAVAMRRILVDRALARNAAKRGGGQRMELETQHLANVHNHADLEARDDALTRSAAEHPEHAELMQLRYFGGVMLDPCAQALGISAGTADNLWAYARAWLAVELARPD